MDDEGVCSQLRCQQEWMQLFEAYYDAAYSGYKNSESLQLHIAERHGIRVAPLEARAWRRWRRVAREVLAAPSLRRATTVGSAARLDRRW